MVNGRELIKNRQTSRSRNCAACGAAPERLGARFCLVCGKSLSEGYQPLDSLRSSYKMRGKSSEPPEPKANSGEIGASSSDTNLLTRLLKKLFADQQ